MSGILDRFDYEGGSLLLGDCREILPIEADALVVDPPYGISFASQPTKWQRRAGMEAEAWDEETFTSLDFMRICAPVQAVWGGNYYVLPTTRGWLSWFKPDSPPSMGDFELCRTNLDKNARQISHSISATNGERVGHPTQKPVRVMQWTLAQIGVQVGCTILDPCAGSGSTVIACIRTGHKCIAIERDPAHFATMVDRVKRELAQPMLIPPVPAREPERLLL